jgi:hypothetical protein
MKVTRACGDASGDTHLEEVEVPNGPVPTVVIRIGPPQRRSFHDFHPAPARGLVIALQGEFEIATTNGDRKRFGPSEWFFADDVGTKGHTTECFGAVQHLLHCQVPPDWDGWTRFYSSAEQCGGEMAASSPGAWIAVEPACQTSRKAIERVPLVEMVTTAVGEVEMSWSYTSCSRPDHFLLL